MNRLETLQNDPVLEELYSRIGTSNYIPKAESAGVSAEYIKRVVEGASMVGSGLSDSAMEAVILDFLRPCLLIKNDSFSIPDSDTWKSKLDPYRKMLERRIPSVGRVEFKYHPKLKWGGTGWLVSENIIITNRHVAAIFANKSASGITFARNSMGATIEAFVDFNEEYQSGRNAIEVGVEQVLYLADETHPDIAILKLSPGNQFEPIPIFTGELKAGAEIAVIGYPAYDPIRNPLKPEDVSRIFGNIFEYKRLSPGLILNNDLTANVFSHDATTLGGNSGSVVLDLKTGHAAGLHFSGVFHESNMAVNSAAILRALSKTSIVVNSKKPPLALPELVDPELPIRAEAPVESYDDREGYDTHFLGHEVKLPKINDSDNILKFNGNDSVLKYLHFSVVMNQKRRMCFYSAVNINGAQSMKTKRPGWRYDPRIPVEFQIKGECYGNPPKFARGHMTRREDPAWGKDIVEATLGNADSMHVTNTVPQMQPFNAGIWLGLEDYALQHARGDDMKISVFTGPFFSKRDPEKYSVKIPVEFWKVIVFINDNTGKLCATGYTMSQKSFLQEEEFIFGTYETYQVAIKSIEDRAGIYFDGLVKVDPYIGEEVMLSPLQDFAQIKFK
jgi:endonuclease G